MATRKSSTKNPAGNPVIVTTEHRGVFFGYTSANHEKALERNIISLTNPRMVVYWSQDAHGVVGIGTRGPGVGARVSPRVPSIALRNLTAIYPVTPEAAEKVEAEPWK